MSNGTEKDMEEEETIKPSLCSHNTSHSLPNANQKDIYPHALGEVFSENKFKLSPINNSPHSQSPCFFHQLHKESKESCHVIFDKCMDQKI